MVSSARDRSLLAMAQSMATSATAGGTAATGLSGLGEVYDTEVFFEGRGTGLLRYSWKMAGKEAGRCNRDCS